MIDDEDTKHSSIGRNRSETIARVKEMIIGVGNGKFAWMYGMKFGVLRVLGGMMNFLAAGWTLKVDIWMLGWNPNSRWHFLDGTF